MAPALSEISEDGRSISFKNFYARRSLRIFPAFYAYAALLLAFLVVLHKHINIPQTLAALFYVNDYYQAIWGDPNTGFSHTWSLAVEEQFYLLWAPALLVLLRRGRVLPALVTAIVTLWVYRLVLTIVGVHSGYIYEAFDTRADHLLIGCLLAFLLFEQKWTALIRFACQPWMVLTNIVILAILNTLEFRYGAPFRDTFAFLVEPVLVALLIPGLINASATLAGRFLESPPVAGMGRISYSIYLYQQLTIGPVEKALHGKPLLLQAAASLAVTIFAALLSYRIVEKPFLRLKSRFQSAGQPVQKGARMFKTYPVRDDD